MGPYVKLLFKTLPFIGCPFSKLSVKFMTDRCSLPLHLHMEPFFNLLFRRQTLAYFSILRMWYAPFHLRALLLSLHEIFCSPFLPFILLFYTMPSYDLRLSITISFLANVLDCKTVRYLSIIYM